MKNTTLSNQIEDMERQLEQEAKAKQVYKIKLEES